MTLSLRPLASPAASVEQGCPTVPAASVEQGCCPTVPAAIVAQGCPTAPPQPLLHRAAQQSPRSHCCTGLSNSPPASLCCTGLSNSPRSHCCPGLSNSPLAEPLFAQGPPPRKRTGCTQCLHQVSVRRPVNGHTLARVAPPSVAGGYTCLRPDGGALWRRRGGLLWRPWCSGPRVLPSPCPRQPRPDLGRGGKAIVVGEAGGGDGRFGQRGWGNTLWTR
jgi:hypothetical protein